METSRRPHRRQGPLCGEHGDTTDKDNFTDNYINSHKKTTSWDQEYDSS